MFTNQGANCRKNSQSSIHFFPWPTTKRLHSFFKHIAWSRHCFVDTGIVRKSTDSLPWLRRRLRARAVCHSMTLIEYDVEPKKFAHSLLRRYIHIRRATERKKKSEPVPKNMSILDFALF